jgi:hypothetical protein
VSEQAAPGNAGPEALLGPEGYTLVRDTPLTEVLPWRVLEFERS